MSPNEACLHSTSKSATVDHIEPDTLYVLPLQGTILDVDIGQLHLSDIDTGIIPSQQDFFVRDGNVSSWLGDIQSQIE